MMSDGPSPGGGPGVVHGLPLASPVAWTYDPWRENARVAWLAATSALALTVLVVLLQEALIVTIGLVVSCLAAFSPAIAPVECRLDAECAARRSWLGWERRPWALVRRVQELPSGVLLSPYAKAHWLDAQRGLTLPMPVSRRAELLGALHRLRVAHVG